MLVSPKKRKIRVEENKRRELGERPSGTDRGGFIISQALYPNLYYGVQGSRKAACGPIACYNVAKALGYGASLPDILEEFEKKELLDGDAGSSVFTVINWLKQRGFYCKTVAGKKVFPMSLATARAIVVFYYSLNSKTKMPYGHFVTLVPVWEQTRQKRDENFNRVFMVYNGGCAVNGNRRFYGYGEISYEDYFKSRRPVAAIGVYELVL